MEEKGEEARERLHYFGVSVFHGTSRAKSGSEERWAMSSHHKYQMFVKERDILGLRSRIFCTILGLRSRMRLGI